MKLRCPHSQVFLIGYSNDNTNIWEISFLITLVNTTLSQFDSLLLNNAFIDKIDWSK